jgi:hypothetical protein
MSEDISKTAESNLEGVVIGAGELQAAFGLPGRP